MNILQTDRWQHRRAHHHSILVEDRAKINAETTIIATVKIDRAEQEIRVPAGEVPWKETKIMTPEKMVGSLWIWERDLISVWRKHHADLLAKAKQQ